ncbi:hypothetical protein LX36DRAFT_283299 [Colletotrichum falcatum]|nr:hypothetical protein LX36DRAFT_283299 [Colletotrichum falcatum]
MCVCAWAAYLSELCGVVFLSHAIKTPTHFTLHPSPSYYVDLSYRRSCRCLLVCFQPGLQAPHPPPWRPVHPSPLSLSLSLPPRAGRKASEAYFTSIRLFSCTPSRMLCLPLSASSSQTCSCSSHPRAALPYLGRPGHTRGRRQDKTGRSVATNNNMQDATGGKEKGGFVLFLPLPARPPLPRRRLNKNRYRQDSRSRRGPRRPVALWTKRASAGIIPWRGGRGDSVGTADDGQRRW